MTTQAAEAETTLGSGGHQYRRSPSWGELPDGWVLGDVGGVGVDEFDRVYVFNRGEHPMVVFDRDGRFLTSWGEGAFVRPHAVHMAPDQTIYCADDDAHTVSQVTIEGAVLRVFGTPGQTPGFMSGKPFCRCTHSAITPQGDVLISDGYGNARIHKYSADGTLISSWGSPGVEPGQFNLPHNLVCDADGWVYVADRENHRIQVFDTDGNVHDVWHNLHRPSALSMSPEGLLYVGEIGPYLGSNRGTPNLGPRVSILDTSGSVMARLQVTPSAGAGPGQFVSPHSIAVDSHGDIYVGEVSGIAWPRLFPGTEKPADLSTIHKYVKVQETN